MGKYLLERLTIQGRQKKGEKGGGVRDRHNT